MTNEAAAQEIRAITRTCRGPMRSTITPADYAKMSDTLTSALGAVQANGDANAVKSQLLAESKRDEASELDELLRQGCGADFNAIVTAGPLDGAVHDYQCSHCGVTGIYRAPLYPLGE